MKLHVLILSVLALFELRRAESSTACDGQSPCTDDNYPDCIGTAHYRNGTIVNGKCLSSEDAYKKYVKALKRCATITEKAGFCECKKTVDSPQCKYTTQQEVEAVIADECWIYINQIFKYCNLKEGFCSGASIDGLAHRRFISKSVCCHKDCPICGGNKCGQQTDSSGKKLGARNCCGRIILKREKVCGKHPAPCKMAVKGEDVFEDLFGLNQI